jgi:alpha-beta hydrolase superfamily lysophospholipase
LNEDALTLPTDDGFALHVHRWLPDGAPRAILVISHGMSEHGARYRRLATEVVGRGVAVYAPDHRGHGMTARTVSDLGFFADSNGFDRVVSDLRTVVDRARADYPGVPYLLLGHSMGSYLVQGYMLRYDDPAAVAMTGSSLNVGFLPSLGRRIARLERLRVGPRKSSWLLTRLSFGAFARTIRGRRTQYDWLSRDPAEVDAYVADPLCGFSATTQLWIDLLDMFPKLADPAEVAKVPADLPLWVASGEKDPVHEGGRGFSALKALYEKRGFTQTTFTLYAGARHELFNETNRADVTADFLSWMDKVLA